MRRGCRTVFRREQSRAFRGERGFTLIELMIVILVILVLAAILIPQFGLARERARKASCVSNQRNLETAVAMWETDNPAPTLAGGTMNNSVPSAPTLSSGLQQYVSQSMYIEPDDPGVTDGSTYYLSNGTPGNPSAASSAVPTNPSYGHVACAADQVADPWVAGYDGATGPIAGIDHTRGIAASP
jgi:prepilin-type N-terminal cleavage/methylation domain-containing protein